MKEKYLQRTERKKAFLKEYLRLVGADFEEEDNTFDIELPDSLRDEFKRRFKLTFNAFSPQEDGSTIPEEVFFENLYQICLKRGNVASFIIDEEEDSIDVLDNLRFIDLHVERGGSYTYLKQAVILHFQVTVNQPEYWKKLYHIPIDPNSLKIINWIPDNILYDSIKPLKPKRKALSNKKIHEVYAQSCLLLERKLESDLKDFQQRIERHLQKAIDRISNYYSRLRLEEKKRIELLESQVKKTEDKIKKHKSLSTFSRYLEEKRNLTKKIEEEKIKLFQYLEKIKIFELKEKKRERERHEIICNVDLIAISLLHYRIIREMLLLYCSNSKAILNVFKVPIALKIEEPICQSCKKPTLDIGLCSNSHIVCPKCLHACYKCRKRRAS